MFLISALVSALAMWLVIWLTTGRDRMLRLLPFLLISIGVGLSNFFLLKFLGAWGLLIAVALLVLALYWFCLLNWWRIALATLTWLLSQILSGLFVSPIF